MATNPNTTQKITDWYRTSLGRDADAGGAAYWQKQLDSGRKAEDVYADFQYAAKQNNEIVKPVAYAQANQYTGPSSVNRNTPVDDWSRNVLGRELSQPELSTWENKFSVAGGGGGNQSAQQVYQDFLNTYSSEAKRPMDLASASQINSGLNPLNPVTPPAATTLDINSLDRRTINPATETVRGQLESLTATDSPYMQRMRSLGQREAASRGLINSSMAATAGEAAALDAALNIATPDASTYGRAGDYNVALLNQGRMWNAEQQNQFARQQLDIMGQQQRMQQQIDAEVASQQRQLQDNAAGRASQLTLAQMQNETDRWRAQLQDSTSRYNTDTNYRQQVENQKRTLVNNIIHNMDLSPDRKSALLRELGEAGLASAIYVVDSTAADLRARPVVSGIAANNFGGS